MTKPTPLLAWPLAAGLLLAAAVSLPHWAARRAELTGDFLSHTAYTSFIILAGLLLLWRGLRAGPKLVLWRALAVGTLTPLCVETLKTATRLPRPRDLAGHVGRDGFPSGHTTFSFALAWLLTQTHPRLAPVWYAVAVAIGWSRVEGHAHFGYQVLCGALLGTAIAWAATHGPTWARARRAATDAETAGRARGG